MTRFFVTMRNAIELCEYAMKNMVGGEIFISNMGKLNIKDLAEQFLVHFNSNSKLKIIGTYPGEKLYEELLLSKNPRKTKHPKIFRSEEPLIEYSKLEKEINSLKK